MRATQWHSIAAVIALVLAASSAWAAVTGTISGVVGDSQTREALAGANVSVLGTELSTVTDAQGRFSITNVPPGSYTVSVDLVGYTTAHVTGVVVTQDHVSALEVALDPKVEKAAGAEVKVTAARVRVRSDVTASVYVTTAADEQMTLSQPNDRYQFPGLVFAQPGVVPDNTFYPHIRGARANQVSYLLDGIPITDPNSNVFATNVVSIGLDRLELFTGGYPAEYGGFTGGVINQVVKRGDQMRGALIDVGAGTPYDFGGVLLETGDVDGRADWYYGTYDWHTKFNDNLFTSEAPTVSDHIAKVVYDAGARDKVTVLAHHGYARYLFPFERMFTFDPITATWGGAGGDDYGRQGDDLQSIALNHTLSPTAFWTLRLSRMAHFLELELGDPDNAFWQHRHERMFIAQFDYQRQMGPHRLAAGVWQINSDNRSRFSVFGTQYSPFGLLDSVANNDTRNLQAYVEDKFQVNDALMLSLGARRDKMTYKRPAAGDLDVDENSTRAGLTYTASPRFLVRASAGQYVEFPRADLIAAQYLPHETENPMFSGWGWTWDMLMFPNFPVRPQIDRTREVGFEWKADEATLVTATYFHRDSNQMMQRWHGVIWDGDTPIPSYDPANFDPDAPVWFAGTGTGTTRGLEVKVDRRLRNNLRGWLSYTYLNAKATSNQDNLYPFGYGFLNSTDPAALAQEFPVDWDQRRTIAVALRWKLGKFVVNPWAFMGSGFPYGQSGLDVGGSDPAHVPNPNWDPSDPSSPEELVVPENYVDPSDPSKGFVTPNARKTDKNLTVSLNLSYQAKPDCEFYVQIYNLFARDDETSRVIFHPRTGALLGNIEGDAVYYVPWSRTPPRFVAFGVRKKF